MLLVGVILVLVILNGGDEQAEPSPAASPAPSAVATPTPAPVPLTPEQIASARMPYPVDVPDGMEALAVRVNFVRGVAATPQAGDLIRLYRLPQAAVIDPNYDVTLPQQPEGGQLFDTPIEPETVLDEVEILGVVGAVPSSNDGNLTVLLALDPIDVPLVMTLANEYEGHANELWFTLLPSPEDEATEAAPAPSESETEASS